ncbi:MAG: helix-turn-helix domain-containing protein [Clostridiaceae bacterium]|nr:helix-turn-helix domain-containing protein [Clostridiaceae bacterium]
MDYQNTFSCKDFGLRLAKLRQSRGVSARQMSLDIGQNKNYINAIETGKNYPNMEKFFDICRYLRISPKDFFQNTDPEIPLHQEFNELLNHLSPKKCQHLYLIACDMNENSMENDIRQYSPK